MLKDETDNKEVDAGKIVAEEVAMELVDPVGVDGTPVVIVEDIAGPLGLVNPIALDGTPVVAVGVTAKIVELVNPDDKPEMLDPDDETAVAGLFEVDAPRGTEVEVGRAVDRDPVTKLRRTAA